MSSSIIFSIIRARRKRYIYSVSLAIIIFLFLFNLSLSQTLPEDAKRAIVRIETPDRQLGTGFIIQDSVIWKANFLVTNKHVVKNKNTDSYFDSIFVRMNTIEDGIVTSDQIMGTLYLKVDNIPLYLEHKNPNIDLLVIMLGDLPIGDRKIKNPINIDLGGLLAFNVPMIATRNQMDSLRIREGTSIQSIGFSFQNPEKEQYHISRYGKIALFNRKEISQYIEKPGPDSTITEKVTCQWMILDISARKGDSGGPVFTYPSNKAWLIGINMGTNSKLELGELSPKNWTVD